LVERFHQCLKDARHARLASTAWTAHLLWVLRGLCASPRKAVFDTPIVLPGQFLDENENFDESDFYKNLSQAVRTAEAQHG
jgi:hypothetical protein